MERIHLLAKDIGRTRILAVIIFIVFFGSIYLVQPPHTFPKETVVTITSGEAFSDIARDFKNQHLIHSTLVFRLLMILSGGERTIIAGQYYFDTPLSLFDLTARLRIGLFNIKPEKVTIPEGSTVSQIATIIAKIFPAFDRTGFITLAQDKEGYLFPETYFFLPLVSPEEAITALQDTFNQKLAPYQGAIASSTHSLRDIITIASILEREAKTQKDWEIISGILWKRLAQGMPLQVDATANYYLGKTSAELTKKDLQDNSPYNTYTHKGLPPTPIANPGIETIEAALNPVKTSYWYYLSDKDNIIHYAKTYDEHLRNRRVYLGK